MSKVPFAAGGVTCPSKPRQMYWDAPLRSRRARQDSLSGPEFRQTNELLEFQMWSASNLRCELATQLPASRTDGEGRRAEDRRSRWPPAKSCLRRGADRAGPFRENLPTQRSAIPFCHGDRTLVSRLEARGRQEADHLKIKFGIVVQDQVAIRAYLGKRFAQLLDHPL